MTSLLEDRTLVAPAPDAEGRYLMLVRKDFPTEAADRLPGEVVDVAEWPNALKLVDAGYLLPFNGSPVEQGGRLWRDQQTADRFAPVKATRRRKPPTVEE